MMLLGVKNWQKVVKLVRIQRNRRVHGRVALWHPENHGRRQGSSQVPGGVPRVSEGARNFEVVLHNARPQASSNLPHRGMAAQRKTFPGGWRAYQGGQSAGVSGRS